MEKIATSAFPALLGGEDSPGLLELCEMPLPTFGQVPDFYALLTKMVRERNWVEDGYYLASGEVQNTIKILNNARI